MPVIIAALGYFVDIYDLQLFGIVRVPSLESLGLSPAEVDSIGVQIINHQMIGLLLGGILWGSLGDKKEDSPYFWFHHYLLHSQYCLWIFTTHYLHGQYSSLQMA